MGPSYVSSPLITVDVPFKLRPLYIRRTHNKKHVYMGSFLCTITSSTHSGPIIRLRLYVGIIMYYRNFISVYISSYYRQWPSSGNCTLGIFMYSYM